MFKFVKEIVAKENRWGLVIGAIVFVVGFISNLIFPYNQIISFILQAVTVVIIPQMLNNYINRSRSNTIDVFTERALQKIDNKYKEISSNSTNLFEIFHLNDGVNFFNVSHNIFYNNLIKSYSINCKDRIYHIPTDTYYQIIQDFLKNGYKMQTINGTLLPYWYVPKVKNEALENYTTFCQRYTALCERVTYYQDYKDDSWKDDTVKMIYDDLLSSEKSDDVAVLWLITLIANIDDLRNEFGEGIKNKLGLEELRKMNYFQYDNPYFKTAIKDNINEVIPFLEHEYDGDSTISKKMTKIINEKFYKDMKGKNKFVGKTVIDAKFGGVVYFKDVTSVCHFQKENEQFVMLQKGSNAGRSIEITIIIDESKITEISNKLSELLHERT